jgi:hypothetical protein
MKKIPMSRTTKLLGIIMLPTIIINNKSCACGGLESVLEFSKLPAVDTIIQI